MSNGVVAAQYGPGSTWQIGGSRFAAIPYNSIYPQGMQYMQPDPGSTTVSVAPAGLAATGASMASTTAAMQSPLDPRLSPLPWAVLGLFLGVLYIHKVWRRAD